MTDCCVRLFVAGDEQAVIELWRRCGLVVPSNDPAQDIRRKLEIDPTGLLVADDDGQLIGTVMLGYEGHRGWINYLAVLPDRQHQGVGRALMEDAERRLASRGCPKINLQVRQTNVEVLRFYETIGYTNDACVSMGKRLVEDRR